MYVSRPLPHYPCSAVFWRRDRIIVINDIDCRRNAREVGGNPIRVFQRFAGDYKRDVGCSVWKFLAIEFHCCGFGRIWPTAQQKVERKSEYIQSCNQMAIVLSNFVLWPHSIHHLCVEIYRRNLTPRCGTTSPSVGRVWFSIILGNSKAEPENVSLPVRFC